MRREMQPFTEPEHSSVLATCARTLADQCDLVLGAEDTLQRACSDAAACHARFRLPGTAASLRPVATDAAALFDILVESRAEVLGAVLLPGIAGNFSRWRRPIVWSDWAYAALRGQPETACPQEIAAALADLVQLLDSPDEFAREACRISIEFSTRFPLQSFRQIPDAIPGQDASIPDMQQSDVAADRARREVGGPALPQALLREYAVFTKAHDCICLPSQLASQLELQQLRARLDSQLLPYRQTIVRLAHQLQRLLQARQRRHWSLDLEEGSLDPSRLSRLASDPVNAAIFRQEEESRFPQTCVTLLLDNSSSMRGHPMLVTALTADILTRALERCAIKVEVLGFTTVDRKGGVPAEEWRQAGCPENPGRLNALRYIVYKPMDMPWRRAHQGFGLLLKEDLLQENIDGEALYWACRRLAGRSESRRLLIVISDGEPMDKSTLAANPAGYLEKHLHQVIDWIEKNSDIELRAIGIGHPVARFYRNSISLARFDELGPVLIKKLGEWLC